jgi:hypothetical protein
MKFNEQVELIIIEKSISRWTLFLQSAFLLVCGTYLVWFFCMLKQPLSQGSDNWGQFGDFVGGILNPVMAYAAFFWLTKSVRLQKQELAETKTALQDSANAQEEQVKQSILSSRLTALSALSSSIMAEVAVQREELQFLAGQMSAENGVLRGNIVTLEV